MPPESTIRTFLEAIRTRRTRTTQALDELYRTRGAALAANLNQPDALDGLPLWLRNELRDLGTQRPDLNLNQAELNHIHDWPDNDKRRVRDALVHALANGQTVLFFWELHLGPNSITDIPQPLPATGDVVITFRNPESNVRVRGGPGPDDVTVAVP